MAELLRVGIADYKVGRSPNMIISYGLGSCVGITLYDSKIKVGGLVHIMLPDSTQARANENPAKFADTGIPLLLKEIIALGAEKSRVEAKLAGGSQMFQFAGASDIMAIGKRNAELAKKTLQQCGIRIISEDLGGTYGRTVEMDLNTGLYKIKTINKGEKTI
ncbi:chemotaxis protein CheD [Pectinatus cerevisiiphilus]|uniref:Probable chemoreceptor glutamine deamidase CheD n=1 Tax=Pectinatus cerevisiiphilus TaxID=86956 RepID=A0A4R3KDE4_9FIRM|nr:chemotaxis protein CheD [Pectinatus cerevisiiphilus]TCS80969.1 chemotaxis protein CheD [Pectinatus cerevisiiphilus]